MYKNLSAALAAACFSFPLVAQTPASTPSTTITSVAVTEPLKIGFVYVAPLTEAGWVRQHENARLALEKNRGARVKTT